MAAKRSRVDEAADELYGLPADEFTAARNEAAAAARTAGETDAAKAISALRRPNAVAAAANALVRAHGNEVDELVRLGATMRDATADLDADLLRKLSTQQRKVIAALVGTARRDSTGTFSDATARGLEETLHAAMADPDAAEQLTAGRLTSGLTSRGFPGIGASLPASPGPRTRSKVASKAASKVASKARPDEDAAAAAEAAEADARDALAAAQDDADAAEQQAGQADQDAEDAAAEVARLEDELARAREARVDADRAARDARRARDRAATAADRAERELRSATAARERLQQG